MIVRLLIHVCYPTDFITEEGITKDPFLHTWQDVYDETHAAYGKRWYQMKQTGDSPAEKGVRVDHLVFGFKLMLKQVEQGYYSPDINILEQARKHGERMGPFGHGNGERAHAVDDDQLQRQRGEPSLPLASPAPTPEPQFSNAVPVEDAPRTQPRSPASIKARERVARTLARGAPPMPQEETVDEDEGGNGKPGEDQPAAGPAPSSTSKQWSDKKKAYQSRLDQYRAGKQ